MKKRFLAGLAAFCLFLTLLPFPVFAAESNRDPALKTKSAPDAGQFQSNEDFKPYDPWYPEKSQYGSYTLQLPELTGRMTFAENASQQTIGTLFAPGVSRTSGWKNATKLWGTRDSGLCFAASASNLIAWYLERYQQQHPEDSHPYETNEERIFDRFRDGWDPDTGGDPIEALSWYFTGGFPSGRPNPNNDTTLTGREPGGYLRPYLPNNTCERWSQVSFSWEPKEIFNVYGSSCDNQFPYIEEVGGLSGNGAFSTLEGFSEQVLRQMHYGPSILSVLPEVGQGITGHAITLWGVDYDVNSGLITRLHVTDSDDSRSVGLFSIDVERGPHNDGIRLVNYFYHPPIGSSKRFTRILDSVMMYAPEVVKSNLPYTGADAVIDSVYYDPQDRSVQVQVSNIGNHRLEFGYSYDRDPEHVVFWQQDSRFVDLEPDQYYFFARVKQTESHLPGGESAPSPYRVATPSPSSSRPVASLSFGTHGFQPFGVTSQYIWFGTEHGADAWSQPEPILWRVLDNQTNLGTQGLFLIADKLYGTGADGGLYFADREPYTNAYASSSARRWCRSFEAENFSALERDMLLSTFKTDEPFSAGSEFAFAPDILTGDRVFLPSAQEISAAEYGLDDAQSRLARYQQGFGSYWLRSPAQNGNAGMVSAAGDLLTQSVITTRAARPAFNLDSSQLLYAAAAADGVFSESLGLQRIQDINTGDFRLVFRDANRNFRVTPQEITVSPDEVITLSYQGAQISQTDTEFISVILASADGSTPLYYGRLTPALRTNDELSFSLPAGLACGTYTLRVFNEQYINRRTSGISSAFCDIPLTIQPQKQDTPIPGVNLTIPAPRKGETPQPAQSSEADYQIIQTIWMPADTVFQPDTAYRVSIELQAADSFVFTQDTRFALNGNAADALIAADGTTCVLTYDAFPKTEAEPAPDSSEPTPDSSEPTPDSSEPTPDSSEPTPDSSEPTPDSSEPTPDSSEPTPDSSEPAPDSSEPTPDSSEPTPDSSEPTPDSSEPTPDSSEPTPDSSEPTPDSSEPTPDSSDPTPDSSEPTPDSSEPTPDSSSSAAPDSSSAPIVPQLPSKPTQNIGGTAAKVPNSGSASSAQPHSESKPDHEASDAPASSDPQASATEPSDSFSSSEANIPANANTASSNQPVIWCIVIVLLALSGTLFFFILKRNRNRKQ